MYLGWQVCITMPSPWFRWDLVNLLPRLVLNLDPSNLHLPNSQNYRHEPPEPSCWRFLSNGVRQSSLCFRKINLAVLHVKWMKNKSTSAQHSIAGLRDKMQERFQTGLSIGSMKAQPVCGIVPTASYRLINEVEKIGVSYWLDKRKGRNQKLSWSVQVAWFKRVLERLEEKWVTQAQTENGVLGRGLSAISP
jgi:hypothetical protein